MPCPSPPPSRPQRVSARQAQRPGRGVDQRPCFPSVAPFQRVAPLRPQAYEAKPSASLAELPTKWLCASNFSPVLTS
jgi:hypothetical protein